MEAWQQTRRHQHPSFRPSSPMLHAQAQTRSWGSSLLKGQATKSRHHVNSSFSHWGPQPVICPRFSCLAWLSSSRVPVMLYKLYSQRLVSADFALGNLAVREHPLVQELSRDLQCFRELEPCCTQITRKRNRDCDRSGLHRNCCGLAGSSLQLCFPQQSLLGGLSSLHSHRRMAQAIVLSSALAPLGRSAAVSRACWRGCRWWPRWRVSGQQRSGVRRQGAGGEGG